MIHEAKGQLDPEEVTSLRLLAMEEMWSEAQAWAQAASEDPKSVAWMLGATNTPERHAMLTKILAALGRTPPE